MSQARASSIIALVRSPGGAAKVCVHGLVVNFLKARGICACAGIPLHRESPDRVETHVWRRVVRAVDRIALRLVDTRVAGPASFEWRLGSLPDSRFDNLVDLPGFLGHDHRE